MLGKGLGAGARGRGPLESLLLTVGSGDEVANALLLMKESLALQAEQLGESSLSRPKVLRGGAVRGEDDVERQRSRSLPLRRLFRRLRLAVVAGCRSDRPASLTNVSAAAIRRKTASVVELVNRGLQLALKIGDLLGVFQNTQAYRVKVGSLGGDVVARSNRGAEAIERLGEPVG